MPRAIDPVILTTTDGEERKFLLTMGGIRRLKTRFGQEFLKEIMTKDAQEACVPILWEAMIDKAGLTQETFEDILPADMIGTAKAVAQLLGVSFPESKDRPTPASPEIGTGSASGVVQ